MKNNVRLTILRYASYGASMVWIATGLIIIGSIYLSSSGFFINLIIGVLFILLGIFFYSKEKTLLQILSQNHEDIQNTLYKKSINGEIILAMLTLFLGLMLLSAASSRVFVEGYPVFG